MNLTCTLPNCVKCIYIYINTEIINRKSSNIYLLGNFEKNDINVNIVSSVNDNLLFLKEIEPTTYTKNPFPGIVYSIPS